MKSIHGLFVLLVAAVALPASAIEAASAANTARHAPEPVLAATGAFLALSVADMQASGKWYAEKLGLKVTMQPPRSGPANFMVLEGGGIIVELVQHDAALSLAKLTPKVNDPFMIHGFFKAGVLVADFDKTLALLKERGVAIAFGPYPAKDGRRANFIVRDNAGNLIHFFGS
jgi:catechol 2,3-dioxygenase-like lactoylglutathione lyase family enzyme